jgi:alkylated DNA repair protein (DNA oxidative demethylase)
MAATGRAPCSPIDMQSALFESPPLPGLIYRADLLTAAEESRLVAHIRPLDFAPFEFQGWEGKRRTVSFGWAYDFNDSRLREAPSIPDFLLPLRDRAAALARVEPASFVHALVIEYDVGAGIGWHRDRPAFGVVAGVSLLAPCTLRFRRREGKRFARVSLELAPRSAYVLTGAVRHEWEHSIAPMEVLRYSVTFRTLAEKRL